VGDAGTATEELAAAQAKVDAASVKYNEARKDDPAVRTADAKEELAVAEAEMKKLKDKQAAEAKERARQANASNITLDIECHVGKATFSCHCDEDHYNAAYEQVTTAVSAAFVGKAVFNKNPPPDEHHMYKYVPPPTVRSAGYETSYIRTDNNSRCRYPRLGAFEVKAMVGDQKPVLVYSKIHHAGHQLPTVAQIEEMVISIQDMVGGCIVAPLTAEQRRQAEAEAEAAVDASATAAQEEVDHAKAAVDALDPHTGVRRIPAGERVLQMEAKQCTCLEQAEWVPPGNIHMAAMCRTNRHSAPKVDGSNSAANNEPEKNLGATKPADKDREKDGEPA
jgi:hypothetical protein